MYYSFKGILILKDPSAAVIECGGVGYKLGISMTTYHKLPSVGSECFLYSHLSVKEDALELYGFYDEGELDAFKRLISVSGVGAKVAMSILSDLTPDKFTLAVMTGDTKAITVAQGVGAKLAQRIILELKDKLSKDTLEGTANLGSAAVTSSSGNLNEAAEALTALGYSRSDAFSAVAATGFTDEDSVDLIIKKALKYLALK